MKVSQLSEMLEHWARGLQPVAGGVASDLRALTAAMGPFADRTVADFSKFLGQCEEFQRTGALAGGRKSAAKKGAQDPELVARAESDVRDVLSAIDRGGVDGQRIEQALQPLNALGKPELDQLLAKLGIAGKSRSKADAVGKIRQFLNNQAEAGNRVQTMSELL